MKVLICFLLVRVLENFDEVVEQLGPGRLDVVGPDVLGLLRVNHDEPKSLGESPDKPLQVGAEKRVEAEELLELAGFVEKKFRHRLSVAGETGAGRLQPEVKDEPVDAARQPQGEVDQVAVLRAGKEEFRARDLRRRRLRQRCARPGLGQLLWLALLQLQEEVEADVGGVADDHLPRRVYERQFVLGQDIRSRRRRRK